MVVVVVVGSNSLGIDFELFSREVIVKAMGFGSGAIIYYDWNRLNGT